MKSLLFILFVVFAFSGCTQDIKSLGKEECRNLGYKYILKKRLNYRTGKYETSSICLSTAK